MLQHRYRHLLSALFGISNTLLSLNVHAVEEQPAVDDANIEINDARIAADCKKIPDYADAGQKAYAKGDYTNARESFIEQVGWSEFCELSDSAIATAYNNVALTYIKQKDFLKARAWLLLDAKDKKSRYNLGLIKNELARLPKSTSPVGEYWQYAGRGQWNVVGIAPKNRQYQLEFSGIFMGSTSMYYGPTGVGEFSMLSPFRNGKAVYGGSSNDCLIRIKVNAGEVQMEEKKSCGFGMNVTATGSYSKVSDQYALTNIDDN
jgi:hypothetical protein